MNWRRAPTPEQRARRQDRAYTRWARAYDWAVRSLPVWKPWLRPALAHIRGPRVLEVSFGTGWLMTQYAGNFQTFGIEYNATMLTIANQNLAKAGLQADLSQGDVVALPYSDACFETVIDTMAFSGYPDPAAAMGEIWRVLVPGGILVLIDVNYPNDGDRAGAWLAKAWTLAGDQIHDLDRLLANAGFDHTDTQIGGRGSVHLYVATKPNTPT
jgi:ubiquinone/menaquinone biosynthesis C-methylase UbiE